MRKNIFMTAVFSLVAIGLSLLPDMAMAASTGGGGTLLKDISGAITGNLGTLVGLGIALFGLYVWIVQQSSWGIIMIIGGVAVTAFPGLFDQMRLGFHETITGASKSNVDAD